MYKILSTYALLGIVLFSYAYAETLTLGLGEYDVDINYSSIGVDIDKSTSDGSETIILDVSVYGDESTITIELPRNFIDAKNGNDDVNYFIIFDGFSLGDYSEESNDEFRTLTFNVPRGVDMIEIVGTTISTSVNQCDVGMTLVDNMCQLDTVCEQGTVLVDGLCQLDTVCEQGTVLVDGLCQLDTVCGQGTVLVDGLCQLDTMCGQGTALVDGLCQLDTVCGQGTVLVDGLCELNARTSNQKSLGFELIYGTVFAFIVAFVLLIIMWSIKHAHKTS